MGNLPYSPDLAPNGFFLFLRVKDTLRSLCITSAKEVFYAFNEISQLRPKYLRKCFQEWFWHKKIH